MADGARRSGPLESGGWWISQVLPELMRLRDFDLGTAIRDCHSAVMMQPRRLQEPVASKERLIGQARLAWTVAAEGGTGPVD